MRSPIPSVADGHGACADLFDGPADLAEVKEIVTGHEAEGEVKAFVATFRVDGDAGPVLVAVPSPQ